MFLQQLTLQQLQQVNFTCALRCGNPARPRACGSNGFLVGDKGF